MFDAIIWRVCLLLFSVKSKWEYVSFTTALSSEYNVVPHIVTVNKLSRETEWMEEMGEILMCWE